MDSARRIYLDARRCVLGDIIASLDSTGFLAPGEASDLVDVMRPYGLRSLIDLGCGSGGLGAWLATQLRCDRYIGIDAVAHVVPTSSESLNTTFTQQRFEGLDLAEFGRVSGIFSHDALYLARDPASVLDKLRDALDAGGSLTATLYVGAGVFEGGIDGRTLEDWIGHLDRAGFTVREATDLTREWRIWAERLHRRRLYLCGKAEMPGPAINGLASISRRMLGLDGREAFLERVDRYRIVAST